MDIKLQSILNDIVNDVLQEENDGGYDPATDNSFSVRAAQYGAGIESGKLDALNNQMREIDARIANLNRTNSSMSPDNQAGGDNNAAELAQLYNKKLELQGQIKDQAAALANYGRGGERTLLQNVRDYGGLAVKEHPVAAGATAGALGTALAAGAGALALRKQRRAAGQ